jgi:hypothetical protein
MGNLLVIILEHSMTFVVSGHTFGEVSLLCFAHPIKKSFLVDWSYRVLPSENSKIKILRLQGFLVAILNLLEVEVDDERGEKVSISAHSPKNKFINQFVGIIIEF